MNTTTNVTAKTLSVPVDILMDILSILFKNEVPVRINSISEKDNILWLDVKLALDHPYRKEIIDNIDALLCDYRIYVNGSPSNMDFAAYSGNNF